MKALRIPLNVPYSRMILNHFFFISGAATGTRYFFFLLFPHLSLMSAHELVRVWVWVWAWIVSLSLFLLFSPFSLPHFYLAFSLCMATYIRTREHKSLFIRYVLVLIWPTYVLMRWIMMYIYMCMKISVMYHVLKQHNVYIYLMTVAKIDRCSISISTKRIQMMRF